MTYRIDTEEELEYKYGDWEEDRVVALGDKGGIRYISYGSPLTTFDEFSQMNRSQNWIPNWPRN